MEKELKLYIWTDFCPDYTSGLAFAIAESETKARKLIINKVEYVPYDWGKLKIKPLNKRTAEAVFGAS